ncbi:MAG: ATP-dependent DNA helicase RecG [Proteobacteria bacterium]|nr:ATP-dependent DNA helicase RecG [Pseudomonadota bacterium]
MSMTAGTQPQPTTNLKLLEAFPRPSGMSPAQYEKLQALTGPRYIDLLTHLPTRILDRSASPTVANAPVGEVATLIATVTRRGAVPPKHIKRPLTIELTDGTAPLRAVFFNPGAWLERAFPLGEQVILSGTVEADNKGKKLIHPDVWNPGKSGAESKHKSVARIWPLYPLTAGVGQGWVARAVAEALTYAQKNPLPEWLPNTQHLKLNTFTQALAAAHTPQTEEDLLPAAPARTRLALDELFATQLALAHARATTRTLSGIAHGTQKTLMQKLIKALPFPLTGAQKNALKDIHDDLSAPRPMLRLLQGDVGSGKTLVALAALLRVVENGHQGALMAPTEILAKQLFAQTQKYLQPLGVTSALLTGSLSAAQKKRLRQHVAEGFVQLIVGTHALLEDVPFAKLGLVVIDEQHRFGVHQRLTLGAAESRTPNTEYRIPDLLVMSATPIPRTLALTAYGDMDLSTLAEKPPGRSPIQTMVMPDSRLAEIATRLQGALQKGEQAYWVCPLVEESEQSDLSAATQRAEWLRAFFAQAPITNHQSPITVSLLHGKMKAAEKAAAMEAFAAGHTQVLVATTVIEVGVDVPGATTMVIEHAERFGLSQLHQLRGRVGRGTRASRCLLLYSGQLGEFAQARLQALRDSEDGFYLAEKDLELRGPGEILGRQQSGEVQTRLADLHHHKSLLPVARDLAEKTLAAPLKAPQRNALATLLTVFNKQTAAEWLRGG